MAIDLVLDNARISAEKERLQGLLQDIARSLPAVEWRYSAYSNERFPLRAYASAVRGSGPEADEPLVIAVTWRKPSDEPADRLEVRAAILDEDGVVIAESPSFDIPIPDEPTAPNPSNPMSQEVSTQVHAAMQQVGCWLETQTDTIRTALANPM